MKTPYIRFYFKLKFCCVTGMQEWWALIIHEPHGAVFGSIKNIQQRCVLKTGQSVGRELWQPWAKGPSTRALHNLSYSLCLAPRERFCAGGRNETRVELVFNNFRRSTLSLSIFAQIMKVSAGLRRWRNVKAFLPKWLEFAGKAISCRAIYDTALVSKDLFVRS